MMISALALTLAVGMTAVDEKPLVCPIMGSPVSKDAPRVEYAGTSFGFCCAGCDAGFGKDPKAALKKNEKSASPIGEFLFDPVSHKRIKKEQAKGTVDFQGVRFHFATEENMKAFQADSKKYALAPKKESLSCPVMGEAIATYSAASEYVDYEGVRYYICCAGCTPAFEKNPAKYAGKAIKDPAVIAQKKA
ncbi:MAG: YHS domain-containing protein [Fimbriimonadaceae bacterium]